MEHAAHPHKSAGEPQLSQPLCPNLTTHATASPGSPSGLSILAVVVNPSPKHPLQGAVLLVVTKGILSAIALSLILDTISASPLSFFPAAQDVANGRWKLHVGCGWAFSQQGIDPSALVRQPGHLVPLLECWNTPVNPTYLYAEEYTSVMELARFQVPQLNFSLDTHVYTILCVQVLQVSTYLPSALSFSTNAVIRQARSYVTFKHCALPYLV
jgi:hypothetical protein